MGGRGDRIGSNSQSCLFYWHSELPNMLSRKQRCRTAAPPTLPGYSPTLQPRPPCLRRSCSPPPCSPSLPSPCLAIAPPCSPIHLAWLWPHPPCPRRSCSLPPCPPGLPSPCGTPAASGTKQPSGPLAAKTTEHYHNTSFIPAQRKTVLLH